MIERHFTRTVERLFINESKISESFADFFKNEMQILLKEHYCDYEVIISKTVHQINS